jgi:cystathionine gamma-synthase
MMSDYFKPIPFGCSIPIENPHAVSVSLPLLQNVIDYEEGCENAIAKMQSGYPRFFQNKLVKKLVDFVRVKYAVSSDKTILPIASIHAKSILEYLVKTEFNYVEEDNSVFLIVENNSDFIKKCSDYIRNIGLLISSRKAESSLYKLGQITSVFQEEKIINSPEKAIKSVLSKAYSNVSEDAVLLTNCGMNALFSAYQTVVKAREKEGRTTVVQLGWLYVDTMEIIQNQSKKSHIQLNIFHKKQLEEWLSINHAEVAVLITEVTTNPLIQCVDLPWLYSICQKYSIVLIVDVTIATPFNVAVLPYCDIAVESLTKFACGNGDLLMGCLVLNENNEFIKSNKNAFQKFLIPPFEGEIQRLAFQIQGYEERVLKNQSFVKEIYSVKHPNSVENFSKIQKSETSFPGLISIVFDQDLEVYYDKLDLAKGPSLGTEFTLAMPYVYLAHYQDLKNEEGKQKLISLGMNPNLIRLSVGNQDVEKIILAFENLKN